MPILNQQLEIIIPTYNRKPYLQHTLAQLLAPQSPVRTCTITVLDNASTDGTAELVDEFAANHTNIKHIRHLKNIGGNANIARAFEIAQKEYFWVLCDDDEYNFTAWSEVEKAIDEKQGLIVVNRQLLPDLQKNFAPAELMRLLTFCPAAIHRSDTITPEILINIYYNTANWFPHLAAVCAAFNKQLPFYVCSRNIVLEGKNDNHKGLEFHRKTPHIAYPFKMQFFEVSYFKSLALLEDKKIRFQAAEHFEPNNKGFFHNILLFSKQNIIEYHDNIQNYTAPLISLSFWQKMRFCAAVILTHLLFILLYPRFAFKKRKFYDRLRQSLRNGESQ